MDIGYLLSKIKKGVGVMALKVKTKEVKKTITLLTDPRAGFVSLVKHAASRQPFRVIKTEKGGNVAVKSMVIQSILLPNGITVGDLAVKSEMNWLSDVSTEKSDKYDNFTKFTQISVEKFEQKSLKLVKIDKSGAFILAGQLLPGVQAEGVITLGEDDVAKASTVPIAPMDATLGQTNVDNLIAQNFAGLFDRETYSMLDIVHGLLRQTSTDPEGRKVAILTALDGYKNFIAIGLDALKDSAAKLEGSPEKFIKSVKTEVQTKTTDKGEEDMELFKDREEFIEAVKGVLVVHDATAQKVEDARKSEEAMTKRDGNFTTLTETVQKMAETVNSLVKKTEKMDGELDTDTTAADSKTADGESKTQKDEDTKAAASPKGIDLSVFSGLLTTKKTTV